MFVGLRPSMTTPLLWRSISRRRKEPFLGGPVGTRAGEEGFRCYDRGGCCMLP